MTNCNDNVENMFIELHIWRRSVKNERNDLCAVFEFPRIRDELVVSSSQIGRAKEANFSSCSGRKCQPEQLVFVRVIEISQDGKKGREVWVRSVVRLQALNDCTRRDTECRKTSFTLIPEISTRITYREHKPVFMGWGILSGFVNSDCVHKVVERTSKIVDNISNLERPSLQRRLIVDPQDNAISGRIGICLEGQTIRIRCDPGDNFVLEGVEAFVRMQ